MFGLKIGRKIRIFSLGRENNNLMKEKSVVKALDSRFDRLSSSCK